MDFLTLKRHNSFQNKNNRKATQSCNKNFENSMVSPRTEVPHKLTWAQTF